MTKRILNILVSLIVAGLFFWLAVRNIPLRELWQQLQEASLWWVFPFAIFTLGSHYLRAERWSLLLPGEWKIRKSSLFAGVMSGYFFNNLVPRLGEITRPVYVARRYGLSKSNLVGTIVLERLIDVISMLVIFVITIIFIIKDTGLVLKIFGTEQWLWYHYALIPLVLVIIFAAILFFYRILLSIERKNRLKNPVLIKIVSVARSFGAGMISVRNIQSWPLFIFYTASIWTAYVVMTYLPFYMFDLPAEYNLNFASALVITAIASVGITVPTPAGLGSYHLFVQQALWIVYGVPPVTGLAYATLTHAGMLLLIFISAPVSLLIDKRLLQKKTGSNHL